MRVYPRMRGALEETSLNMTGRRRRVRPMVAWFGGVHFGRMGCAYFLLVARVCDWVTSHGMRCAQCELKDEVWAVEYKDMPRWFRENVFRTGSRHYCVAPKSEVHHTQETELIRIRLRFSWLTGYHVHSSLHYISPPAFLSAKFGDKPALLTPLHAV